MDLNSSAAIATIVAAAITVIAYFQTRRKRETKPAEPAALATVTPAAKKTHATSLRMRQVVDLMNVGRRDPWTVAHFAERLKLERPGELEQILDGTVEPTFEVLEAFSKLTGANAGWLKFGTQQPFSSEEWNDLYPDACLARIRELAPKQTFMVRCKDAAGRSGFLLRLDDLKFVVLRRTWHISSEVGGTGQGQLLSFYHAMKTLSTGSTRDYGHPCGQILDEPTFDRLLAGTIYPGSAIQANNNNLWWDDFTDIEHKNYGAEHYEARYGPEFLAAQKIVCWRLGQDKVAT